MNLIGPVCVTQAFAPLLGVDRSRQGRPGRIVNISSVAGKTGAPYLGPTLLPSTRLKACRRAYGASFMLFGIDVIVVAPGVVMTPMFEKGMAEDLSAYADTEYAASLNRFREYCMSVVDQGLPAERLGDVVYTALTTRSPLARYAPVAQKFKNWTLPMLLPSRTLDRLNGKKFGLSRRRA